MRAGSFLIVLLGTFLVLTFVVIALMHDGRSGQSRNQGGDVWRFLG